MSRPEVHDLDFASIVDDLDQGQLEFNIESGRRVDDVGGIDQGQLDFDLESGSRVDDDGGMRRRADSGPSLHLPPWVAIPWFLSTLPPWVAIPWSLPTMGDDGDVESGRRVDGDGGMRRRRRVDSGPGLHPPPWITIPWSFPTLGSDDDGGMRRRSDSGPGPGQPFRFVPIATILGSDGIGEIDDDDGDVETGRGVDDNGGMRRRRADSGRGPVFRFVRPGTDRPIETIGSTLNIIFHTSGALLFKDNSCCCSPTDDSSSEVQFIARAVYLTALGLTMSGVGLHRFSRRYSSYVMKAGGMGCSLATIVAYASLLPPWLAWSAGAASSILVVTGLAMI